MQLTDAMDATTTLADGTRRSIAAAIRGGEISARDAVERASRACTRSIRRSMRSRSTCRRRRSTLADRADGAVARGDALAPLHGVPVTIKENVDQAGCATTNGVVAYRDAIAHEDSPVVAN